MNLSADSIDSSAEIRRRWEKEDQQSFILVETKDYFYLPSFIPPCLNFRTTDYGTPYNFFAKKSTPLSTNFKTRIFNYLLQRKGI